MPRGKGIYDDEDSGGQQGGKSDAGADDTSQDTPDVDSAENQEPPD